MGDSTFISRVQVKNYKSIARCSVRLRPLNFLVGPNGSGKSNFLDSLRFVADSLRDTLEQAMRVRGGINEVRRRSAGHPNHFAILVDFSLADGRTGNYWFRIGARPSGGFVVQTEECRIFGAEALAVEHHFKVESGVVSSSSIPVPAPAPDRLLLLNASGVVEFRPVYDGLSRMGFYNLNPDEIRKLQSPDAGEILARDGHNLATVLRELAVHHPERKRRVEEYLGKVVPGIEGADYKAIGPQETLEFRQRVTGSSNPWRFPVGNMSDGTLRALGVLVSLFQSGNGSGLRIPLVGIEEPEAALHPAAAGSLLDSLRAASRNTQVLITSHSPDLLDDDDIEADAILAVTAEGGESKIAPIDDAGRHALRDRLFTAGDLLRQDQLRPKTGLSRSASTPQPSLF